MACVVYYSDHSSFMAVTRLRPQKSSSPGGRKHMAEAKGIGSNASRGTARDPVIRVDASDRSAVPTDGVAGRQPLALALAERCIAGPCRSENMLN